MRRRKPIASCREKDTFIRFDWRWLPVPLLFSGTIPALGAEGDPSELAFFEQEAQPVTAFPRLQPVREAPVAVEVITEKEIRASGATTLWDLMRFRVVYHFNGADGRLKTTWGGSYRLSGADSEEAFRSKPEQENAVIRGFVRQSIENSDTGGTEPAYQIATLYAPGSNHAFRASYSMAPTIPSLWKARVDRQSDFTVIMEGNPDLQPSKLQSYELGYHGAYLEKRLRSEANLFYMRFDDLTGGFVKQAGSFFPFPTPSTFSFDNSRKASAKGTELKLTYHFVPGRSVYANYTYETIDDEGSTFTETDRVMIEEATPKHKVNLGAMLRIAAGFSATVNAGYKSRYAISNSRQSEILNAPSYWRVDARLAYNPMKDVELFVAGKNLVSPHHREFPDFLEIPKTYYAGISAAY
jgi:outer membrane receptor protein involved in Fe transport